MGSDKLDRRDEAAVHITQSLIRERDKAEVAQTLAINLNQLAARSLTAPAHRRAISPTLQLHILFGRQRVRAFDVLACAALDEIGVGGDQRLGRIGRVA